MNVVMLNVSDNLTARQQTASGWERAPVPSNLYLLQTLKPKNDQYRQKETTEFLCRTMS
jgi:hypothetical protein